jgi:hypothetical protein
MHTLRRYIDPNQAYFDQSLLEAAGIHAHLSGENAAILGSGAVGLPELRLMIDPRDTAEAIAILERTSLPEDFAESAAEAEESMKRDEAETPPAENRPWWQSVLLYFVLSSLLSALLSIVFQADREEWIDYWFLSIGIVLFVRYLPQLLGASPR